jgi:hypothetical protein
MRRAIHEFQVQVFVRLRLLIRLLNAHGHGFLRLKTICHELLHEPARTTARNTIDAAHPSLCVFFSVFRF